MEMKIEIKGLKETIKFLDDLSKSQLPYATARALTMTAKDVQTEIIRTLPNRFILRSNWYQQSNALGFRVKSATKNNLSAIVGTAADWMPLQEEGGTKIPRGKMLALPSLNVRRNKREKIVKSQRPRALLASGKAFIKGDVIYLRYGGKKNKHLRLMYTLQPKADVHAALHFLETGKKIIDQKFNQNFGTAMNDALRTMR